MSKLVLAALSCLIASNISAQATFHARSGATGGDGTCALPFGSVAEALDAARGIAAPARIRLAGTFLETGLVVDVSDLALEGGFDPAGFVAGCDDASLEASRSTEMFPTTLDGDLDGDRLGDGRIVDVVPGVSDVSFDGITFLRGRAGGAAGPLPPRDGSGGAIRILNAQRVSFTNCRFRENRTTQHQAGGGAIFIGGMPNGTVAGVVSASVSGCVFEQNGAGNGTTSSGSGGAIAAWDFNTARGLPASTFLDATGNTFTSNIARGSGPLDAATWCAGWDGTLAPVPNLDCAPRDGIADRCASRALGGAVSLSDAGGSWDGNVFDSNIAAGPAVGGADGSGQGGGLASYSALLAIPGPQPVITNNVFRENAAIAGAGSSAACGAVSGWGGAAYLANFGSRLSGNVFEANVADATRNANSSQRLGDGGAVAIIGQGTVLVDGNVFRDNRALGGGGESQSGSGGGLLFLDGFNGGTPLVTNNVFESNLAEGPGSYTGYGGGMFLSTNSDPLVARNRFDANEARAPSGAYGGIGGAVWSQIAGGLFADNVISGNIGTNLATTGELRVAGLSFLTRAAGNPALSPRVQNNLLTGNDGAAIAAAGFPIDIDGDGVISVPAEMFYCSPDLRQNTIVGNTGPALFTNTSDDVLLEGNVLWGNDTAATGAGEWFDGYLGFPSENIVVRHSLLAGWPAAFDAGVTDPANMNLLGVDPGFVDAAAGDFHLRQRPDQPTGDVSPLVDAGSAPADVMDYGGGLFDQRLDGVLRAYDGDGIAGPDTIASGTTRNVTQAPDGGLADIGFHYPPAPPEDRDGDGLPDALEAVLGLDPLDADSDDDGLRDGDELLTDTDGDGLIDALDCDSDGDGLVDGLESGVVVPLPDTDITAPCADTGTLAFVADGDASTRTSPILADTDGDGCDDGAEDANRNGVVDPGESDPLDPAGCAPPVLLRINESITSLRGGAAAGCGPRTTPPLAEQLDAGGTCVAGAGCASSSVDATRDLPWTGSPLVLAGAGLPGRFMLTFYEIDGCPGLLELRRDGDDLVLTTR